MLADEHSTASKKVRRCLNPYSNGMLADEKTELNVFQY